MKLRPEQARLIAKYYMGERVHKSEVDNIIDLDTNLPVIKNAEYIDVQDAGEDDWLVVFKFNNVYYGAMRDLDYIQEVKPYTITRYKFA